MPTYGYRCSDCKNEFEIFQKMSDAPLAVCEKCGGPLKKILYPVGISFKGEGFYVNDNAAKNAAKSGGKNASSDAVTEGGATTSGDAAGTTGETKAAETKSETPAAKATPAAPAATATKHQEN